MSQTRSRPALHFTAHHGFTNDPHGIVRVDGVYHMFFQYNPAGTGWSEHCHWGHAVSEDLIRWQEVEVALAPEPGEIGCWSGSAVLRDGGPVILYTRIAHEDWGLGAVALARPRNGMLDWRRDPPGTVIDGPPTDREYIAFRDPQVRRDGQIWRAVLGAGVVGLGGCALQYSSRDLLKWTFDGVVAERSNDEMDPVWSGKVWECPQLLQVDNRWVLLVSVWEDDVLHNVVYAVGDLDGHRFEPSAWGTFSHGDQLYATTTFTDDQGWPCAMSWMREQDNLAPAASPWCSAMSLPHRLSLDGDRLVVSQHPALQHWLAPVVVPNAVEDGGRDLGEVGTTWRIQIDVADSRPAIQLHVDAPDGSSWSIHADPATSRLVVATSAGAELLAMPFGAVHTATLDIVVDTDICEITSTAAEGIGACRVPFAAHSRLRLTQAL